MDIVVIQMDYRSGQVDIGVIKVDYRFGQVELVATRMDYQQFGQRFVFAIAGLCRSRGDFKKSTLHLRTWRFE